MKRSLLGGGTRGFSVLMRYASLDRLSDGYEAQTSPPTRNARAATVNTSNILRASTCYTELIRDTRHSRFNGTKGLVGALEHTVMRYCHSVHSSAGLPQLACRVRFGVPVFWGQKVKAPCLLVCTLLKCPLARQWVFKLKGCDPDLWPQWMRWGAAGLKRHSLWFY